MRQQRAFTVIELLVSMSIVMILILVTSQAYSRLFAHQALSASSEKLYQFLRLANAQSIKYNQKVYVHFCQQATTDRWVMALSEQSSCDCFTANSCSLAGLQQMTELSDGKLVSTSVDDITFQGLQASYSPMRFSVNAGSVTLSDNSGYKLKVIQSTMRLRICAPDGDQLGYKQC